MGEWWRSKNGPRHTVSDGLRWGIGFYIGSLVMKVLVQGIGGHKQSDAMASRAAAPPPQLAPARRNVCAGPTKAFEECLNTNGSNISECQSCMETLAECLKSSITPPQIRVSSDNIEKETRDVRVQLKFNSDKSDNV